MIPPFGAERSLVGDEVEHDRLLAAGFFELRKHLVSAGESRRPPSHHLFRLGHRPSGPGVRHVEFEGESLIDRDPVEEQPHGLRGRQPHRRERRRSLPFPGAPRSIRTCQATVSEATIFHTP